MGIEEDLEKEIRELEAKLKDRKDSIPAHSIRPQQMLVIEQYRNPIFQTGQTGCSGYKENKKILLIPGPDLDCSGLVTLPHLWRYRNDIIKFQVSRTRAGLFIPGPDLVKRAAATDIRHLMING